MLTSEIKRTKVLGALTGPIEELTEAQAVELPNIMEQAAANLGYKGRRAPQRAIMAAEIGPLQGVLAQLEIEVLDNRDVLTYMYEKLFESQQAHLQEMLIDGRPRWSEVRLIQWHDTRLKEYYNFVPDFVLAKALEIKTACPEVEFTVLHLERSPDPFLIAHLGGEWAFQWKECYVIEVWDEAAFERRMR